MGLLGSVGGSVQSGVLQSGLHGLLEGVAGHGGTGNAVHDCTLPLESVAAWRVGNYLPRYALAFIERMEQLENQKCNNSATKAH